MTRIGGISWTAVAALLLPVAVAPTALAQHPSTVTADATEREATEATGRSVSFGGGDVQPLVPARIMDTRIGNGAPVGAVGESSTSVLQVAGRGGVPDVGAGAVVLNVTVTEPTMAGFVTVFPTGVTRPTASNLNFVAGQTVPNLVVVKLGKNGTVSLFNRFGSSHLLVDVTGWFPESSGLQPMTPTRALDTRLGVGAAGPIGTDTSIELQLAGRHGLPAGGVGAVVLNVTATEPTATSFVTVHPAGVSRPTASNINFQAGQTVPNLVVVKLGSGGSVELFNRFGNVHLVADLVGWFPTTSGLNSISPTRFLDTRLGVGAPTGPIDPDSTIGLEISGRHGLPSTGVGAVILNLTVTEPTQQGFVTAFPKGVTRPTTSSLNFLGGQTVANLVIVKVGQNGTVDLFNRFGSTHLVADVVGWFPAASGNTTTLDLKAGTVLAGPGDVLSFTGSSDSGGTARLAPSADVPAVGSHLAIAAHPRVPDGLFGRVGKVVRNADGSSTVTLATALLDSAFNDITSVYDGPTTPSRSTTPVARLVEGEPCATSGGATIEPIISLGGGSLQWDLSLRQRRLRFVLPLEATVGFSAAFTGSISCDVELVGFTVPVPFATVSATPRFTLNVSGGLTTTASLTTAVTFGFHANGSNVTNLSSFTPTATGDLDAEASAAITFRPALRVAVKLFGITGGFVDLGIDFTGTVEPFALPCADLTLQLTLDFGFTVGKWRLVWDITLASLHGPEIVVHEQTEGCPATATPPGAWRGWVAAEEVSIQNPDAGHYEYITRGWWADGSPTSTNVVGHTDYYQYGETFIVDCGYQRDEFAGSIDGTAVSDISQTTDLALSTGIDFPPGTAGISLYAAGFDNVPTSGIIDLCDQPPYAATGGNANLMDGYRVGVAAEPDAIGATISGRYSYTVSPGVTRTYQVCMTRSTLDSDGDGLPNAVDLAPGQAAPLTSLGVPGGPGGTVITNRLPTGPSGIRGVPNCPTT